MAILTGGQRVTFKGYQPPAFGASLSFWRGAADRGGGRGSDRRADRRAGAAAARRLPRDRHARVRRDRPRDLRLDLGPGPVRRCARHERDHEGADPGHGLPVPGRPEALLLSGAVLLSARDVPVMAAAGLQDRTRVERDARGRAGGRRDGHQHDPLQAAGLRDRRRRRLDRRCAVRREPRVAHDQELPDPRVDHGARHHHPRRAREHPGGGPGRAGPDRAAGCAVAVRGVPPVDLRRRADRDHAAAAAGSGAQRPPHAGAQGGRTLAGRVGQGGAGRGRHARRSRPAGSCSCDAAPRRSRTSPSTSVASTP